MSHAAQGEQLTADQLPVFTPYMRSRIRSVLRRCDSEDINPSDVDDLVQDSFVRLLDYDGNALRSFSGDNATAYLCTVAGSVALDFLRKRRCQKRGRDGLLAGLVQASFLRLSGHDHNGRFFGDDECATSYICSAAASIARDCVRAEARA